MQIRILMAGVMLMVTICAGCASTSTRESTGEYLDDCVISTKVKTALLRCTLVLGTDVHVETFKRRVQLSGFADKMKEIEQAVILTRDVEGVEAVVNRIRVK